MVLVRVVRMESDPASATARRSLGNFMRTVSVLVWKPELWASRRKFCVKVATFFFFFLDFGYRICL